MNSASDFLSRKTEIFRAEGYILLNNGSDKLIIGILKNHAYFLAYIENIVLGKILSRYIDTVYIYFALYWRKYHIKKLCKG